MGCLDKTLELGQEFEVALLTSNGIHDMIMSGWVKKKMVKGCMICL